MPDGFGPVIDPETAAERVKDLFAEELEAQRQIREQLESAYGRLRDLYKSRPGMAEHLFLRAAARPLPEISVAFRTGCLRLCTR